MDILDDMGVSKLSAKVFFFKVNYCFKYPGSLNLEEFWLFACQCFVFNIHQMGIKIIPMILFLCAIIVIVLVWTRF